MKPIVILGTCCLIVGAGAASAGGVLVGFASLPADTFAEGPPAGGNDGTGNPIGANGRTGPFSGQPVQGFSAVQFAPQADGAFWFLTDNGFGGKRNSADYLLRIYQARPGFRTVAGAGGHVVVERVIQLTDPDRHIPFPIVNDATRLLTGADFDPESFVIDADGHIWVGDEFGPFILRFDGTGRLLAPPIATPDLDGKGGLADRAEVRSPLNPGLADPAAANLGKSRGYEGMASSPDRRILYPLLEGTVSGDPAGALRIYELAAARGAFTRFVGFYRTAAPGHAIGDFAPVNDREFLVIERDGGQGASARFKKIFTIDIARIDDDGFVDKREIVDLLHIADPDDLNGDGRTVFDFPFVTIENVLVIDETTILVANDNNFPFSVGRGPDIDNTEIILVKLAEPLRVDPHLARPDRDPM